MHRRLDFGAGDNLAGLTNLTTVDLAGNEIGDVGTGHLSGLTNLIMLCSTGAVADSAKNGIPTVA
jgi:hypothetical protein